MSKTVDMSNVTEFEELATEPGHAPTAVKALKV
jgi:tartronate-semialdehyde synthase